MSIYNQRLCKNVTKIYGNTFGCSGNNYNTVYWSGSRFVKNIKEMTILVLEGVLGFASSPLAPHSPINTLLYSF